MTITLNTVAKGVLILTSVLLLVSLILEGFILNTTQKLAMAAIFTLATSLYAQTKDKQISAKKDPSNS